MRALALAVVVAGCAPALPPATPAAPEARLGPDEDLLAAVPAEAEVVLVIDLAQLRGSPWTRDLLAEGTKARAAARDRGFDEARDVDRLVLVRMPAGDGNEDTLSLARGRFQRPRVLAAFRQARSRVESTTFRGCTLLASGTDAIALLSDRTLLSGPLASVRAAIDAAFGRARDIRGERWLRQSRPPSSPTGAAAVELAVRVTDPMRARIRGELDEAQALERVGGRLDLGPRLELRLVGAATTPAQARALGARLQEALTSLRERPSVTALGLADVLGGARVAVRGPEVGAELELTEAQRDDIAARLSSAARLIARARGEEAPDAAPAQKGSP
jgi:hypothetical protein